MEKKNKTYSAIDFARYHAGNMEAKEMHELEKAALEDPFLADALEGYMHTTSAAEDVQHLTSLLAEKTTRKKVYSIASVSQNVWWRVAAIFVLIGIAGYFFFNMVGEEERTIARNETVPTQQKVEQLPAYDSPATAMISENEKREENVMASPTLDNVAEVDETKSEFRQKELAANRRKSLPMPVPEKFSLKKKIEDTTLATSDYTVAENNEIAIAKDEKAQAKIKSADSNDIASISVISQDTPMMAFQSTANAGRSVNKKEAALSEVVVANDDRNRKITSKANPAIFTGKVSGVSITPQSKLQPIEGVENFRYYISKNKQEIIDENNNALHGSILLEFSINKEGKPIDIRVKNSNCPLCEKQAISLLENGPLWKGKSGEKGEVTIVF